MKCWSCQGNHETVAQTKLCHSKHSYKQAPGLTARTRPGPAVRTRDAGRQDMFRTIRDLGAKIDEGGYAIRNREGGQNDISFYMVEKPTDGKWAGRVFVKRRASDETINLNGQETLRVLTAIVADPMGAQLLFGQKLGKCGHCGRSLTTQESRERGIGPKCARTKGWTDAA